MPMKLMRYFRFLTAGNLWSSCDQIRIGTARCNLWKSNRNFMYTELKPSEYAMFTIFLHMVNLIHIAIPQYLGHDIQRYHVSPHRLLSHYSISLIFLVHDIQRYHVSHHRSLVETTQKHAWYKINMNRGHIVQSTLQQVYVIDSGWT